MNDAGYRENLLNSVNQKINELTLSEEIASFARKLAATDDRFEDKFPSFESKICEQLNEAYRETEDRVLFTYHNSNNTEMLTPNVLAKYFRSERFRKWSDESGKNIATSDDATDSLQVGQQVFISHVLSDIGIGVENEELKKLINLGEFRALIANDTFLDIVEDQDFRSICNDENFKTLISDQHFREFIGSFNTRKLLKEDTDFFSDAANEEKSADDLFDCYKDRIANTHRDKFNDLLRGDQFRKLLSNESFKKLCKKGDVVDLFYSMKFISEVDFSAVMQDFTAHQLRNISKSVNEIEKAQQIYNMNKDVINFLRADSDIKEKTLCVFHTYTSSGANELSGGGAAHTIAAILTKNESNVDVTICETNNDFGERVIDINRLIGEKEGLINYVQGNDLTTLKIYLNQLKQLKEGGDTTVTLAAHCSTDEKKKELLKNAMRLLSSGLDAQEGFIPLVDVGQMRFIQPCIAWGEVQCATAAIVSGLRAIAGDTTIQDDSDREQNHVGTVVQDIIDIATIYKGNAEQIKTVVERIKAEVQQRNQRTADSSHYTSAEQFMSESEEEQELADQQQYSRPVSPSSEASFGTAAGTTPFRGSNLSVNTDAQSYTDEYSDVDERSSANIDSDDESINGDHDNLFTQPSTSGGAAVQTEELRLHHATFQRCVYFTIQKSIKNDDVNRTNFLKKFSQNGQIDVKQNIDTRDIDISSIKSPEDIIKILNDSHKDETLPHLQLFLSVLNAEIRRNNNQLAVTADTRDAVLFIIGLEQLLGLAQGNQYIGILSNEMENDTDHDRLLAIRLNAELNLNNNTTIKDEVTQRNQHITDDTHYMSAEQFADQQRQYSRPASPSSEASFGTAAGATPLRGSHLSVDDDTYFQAAHNGSASSSYSIGEVGAAAQQPPSYDEHAVGAAGAGNTRVQFTDNDEYHYYTSQPSTSYFASSSNRTTSHRDTLSHTATARSEKYDPKKIISPLVIGLIGIVAIVVSSVAVSKGKNLGVIGIMLGAALVASCIVALGRELKDRKPSSISTDTHTSGCGRYSGI